MEGKLQNYIMQLEKEAKEYEELLITQFAKEENVNEDLKSKDQMRWVQEMNNIKNRAEEIVLNELIYC